MLHLVIKIKKSDRPGIEPSVFGSLGGNGIVESEVLTETI